MSTRVTAKVGGVDSTQRALDRVEEAADKQLRAGVRTIARAILLDARNKAPVGPRPKRANTPPLAQSLRLELTRRGASVSSDALHAYVQNTGGPVGKSGRITSARASRYFDKAVEANAYRAAQEAAAARDAAEAAFRKTERGSH